MSVASGSKLGAYEIVGPLGAGGMGEVYKAKDTRLSVCRKAIRGVRLAFATHDVVVNGSRLDSLLAELSAQRVSLLREPGSADSGPPARALAINTDSFLIPTYSWRKAIMGSTALARRAGT